MTLNHILFVLLCSFWTLFSYIFNEIIVFKGFFNNVWRKLCEVGPGEVITYGELAKALNNPGNLLIIYIFTTEGWK